MTNIEAYNFIQAALAEYVQILNHASPASAMAIAAMSNQCLNKISLDILFVNQANEAREKGLDLNKLPSYNDGNNPIDLDNPSGDQPLQTEAQYVGVAGHQLEE